MVGKVAVTEGFLRVLQVSPATFIPPLLHIAVTRRTTRRSLWTFQRGDSPSDIGKNVKKCCL